jgi:hypothetical protein
MASTRWRSGRRSQGDFGQMTRSPVLELEGVSYILEAIGDWPFLSSANRLAYASQGDAILWPLQMQV